MWTWSLNWDEVTPELPIGTCPMTPDDIKRIARDGRVSAVLSLQQDDCLAFWGIDEAQLRGAGGALGLVMVRCAIRDFDIADMRSCLPRAVRELAALRARGHRVYVHCTAGLGRSPLTVLGYLVLVEGCSPERAIDLIHAARPGAVPAWEAFYGCLEDLLTCHHNAIEKRAYELYRQGSRQGADADWNQAQVEVLRSVLSP